MRIKFIISYIVIIVGVFFILNNEKESKVESHLQKHTQEYSRLYKTHYDQFKAKSNIVFDILVNTPEVIAIYKQLKNSSLEKKTALRKELYTLLESKYKSLAYTKLQQLHFHLPDNESFLRFHKPESFGDNLSDARETIAYVNKFKKPIDGFEEGRLYSGYRFVFPLSDAEKNHLGSVEVSFNMSVFTAEFMMHFNVLSNFIIDASVVEKKVWAENIGKFHQKSPIDGYYMEKSILKELENFSDRTFTQLIPEKKNLLEIEKAAKAHKPETIYLEKFEEVITMIPVKNPVSGKCVAFVTVRGDASDIKDEINYFYKTFAMVSLFLLIIFCLVYKRMKTQEEAYKVLMKKVEIEVEKNRIKDIEMHKQAKMASLGEMIENIAHQWRQPLNGISTIVTSLKVKNELNKLEDHDIDNCSNEVLRNTQRLSKIIDIFRTFIRGDGKKEQVCLDKVISESLEIISGILHASSISLRKDVVSPNYITVGLVQGQLSQVLVNIFTNAKDMLDEREIKDKWIDVSLNKNDTHAVITIEDNAGGIDEEIFDKIFEPYVTRKDKSIGTGLGLNMSYKIVTEGIGGNLYVENTKNGAKFFIEIPLD